MPGQSTVHRIILLSSLKTYVDSSNKMCTSFRWEVIANYMNLHSTSGIKRTAKDVINKAKTLQKLGEF